MLRRSNERFTVGFPDPVYQGFRFLDLGRCGDASGLDSELESCAAADRAKAEREKARPKILRVLLLIIDFSVEDSWNRHAEPGRPCG